MVVTIKIQLTINGKFYATGALDWYSTNDLWYAHHSQQHVSIAMTHALVYM